MDVNRLAHERRRDILRIAQRHGITRVRLFGSAARGTAGPESDLDLLVDMEPGRSLLDLIGFEQDLEEALHVPVDALTEPSLHRLLRDRVLAEAVPV